MPIFDSRRREAAAAKAHGWENILVDPDKGTRARAEAMFKKSGDRRTKAAAEQEGEAEAVRAKTARLRSLRMAAEADTNKRHAD
jgi:hypothetical protein